MASLGELVVRIETDLTNFNRGLSDANARMQKTRGAMVQGTQQIGRAFTVMGAVITGTFALSAKAAINFEDAFAGVRKTVEATEEEFKQLSSNFRKLSTEIPITAVELAKIGETAGQLGIRGVENLTKFTKTIALLGVTTNISGEQAALSLSRFIKVIGASQGDIERVGAVIVALGNNFAARESEIIDLSVSLASFGRQINLSAAEVLAFATVIKSVGGEAQAASSAFQKLSLKIKDSVITSNKDLKVFAEIAGVTADEFSKKFGEDASGALADFLQGLNRIENAGESTTQALAKVGLADIRLIREIGKVIGANEDLRKGISLASSEWEKNTALTDEARKRFATTASQLKLLKNIIVNVAITIGDVFLPRIKEIIDFLKPAISKIGDWIEKNKKLASILITITLAIGGLMLVLGPLLIILPPIIISVLALSAASIPLGIVLGVVASALFVIAAAAVLAFQGWKIGTLIREVFDLDEALSGPDGMWTKAIIKINEATEAVKRFFRTITFRGEEKQGIAGTLSDAEVQAAFAKNRAAQVGGEEGTPALVSPIPEEVIVQHDDFLTNFASKIGEIIIPVQELAQEFVTMITSAGTMGEAFGKSIDFAKTQMISFQDLLNNVAVTFQKGFAKAFSNVVLGITNAKEAAQALGKQLIAMVVEFFAEWLIHQLLAKAVAVVAAATAIATAVATGAAVASAWAPAAANVSLATLGANAIPAAAALIGTTALAKALAIPTLAEGGIVTKPTLALIGEAGPEAVVPLNKASVGSNVFNFKIEIEKVSNDIDMDELAEMIGENVEEKLRRPVI